MTGKKRLISILISFLVAVTFIPVLGQADFAYGLQGSFSASGKVGGLYQSSAQYNNVTIAWSAYDGAQGYQIYRANKKKGKYKKIATVRGCSYKDKGNKKLGKKKYYKVRAYGKVGSATMYTSYSGILAAKPKVGKPSGLTASLAPSSVTLKWNKVAGATGYQVYRAASRTGKYTRLGTTKKRQYTNTSLTKGQKYYYKVRAYKKKKGKKYGDFCAPVEGMTGPGMAGGFRAVLSGDGTVTCSWTGVTGASGYELQRSSATDGVYITVAETAATSLTEQLTVSGQYFYRVRAYTEMNGNRLYGEFSGGGRTSAVSQARSWVGCKESNGSHKKIIDVYNNFGPKYGRIGYSTSWCAAFVSAVAIKTGNTGVIPVDCYCPRMMNNFSQKTTNKSYTPQGGDVVFYDWNANKVPDHVGMIESVSGNDVTAIEGNYSDAVKRRTFKTGYSRLLAYGLPNYSLNNTVSYTAPGAGGAVDAASVSTEDIQAACEEITNPAAPNEEPATESEVEPTEEPEVELAVETKAVEAAQETDVETAEKIIEYIQEEEPATNAPAEESEFNAFLVYGICDEMDIDACVVTVTEGDGTERSYNEVVLDGELYLLNATEDGGILEKYTPEEIN